MPSQIVRAARIVRSGRRDASTNCTVRAELCCDIVGGCRTKHLAEDCLAGAKPDGLVVVDPANETIS